MALQVPSTLLTQQEEGAAAALPVGLPAVAPPAAAVLHALPQFGSLEAEVKAQQRLVRPN